MPTIVTPPSACSALRVRGEGFLASKVAVGASCLAARLIAGRTVTRRPAPAAARLHGGIGCDSSH